MHMDAMKVIATRILHRRHPCAFAGRVGAKTQAALRSPMSSALPSTRLPARHSSSARSAPGTPTAWGPGRRLYLALQWSLIAIAAVFMQQANARAAEQDTPAVESSAVEGTAAAHTHTVPRPFVATYAVSYRGIGAGTISFTFSQDEASGRYSFDTRPHPNALARLFVSSSAAEHSVMEIGSQAGPEGVRPLHWTLDDGKSGRKDDGELRFDWAAQRVHGEVEGEPVDLPTEPGLQDRSSIQIAVSTALLRGVEPGTIALIDDNRIKYYTYVPKEPATLQTKLGRLEARVYESTRPGSSRVSRLWLMPELDFLPARAEQIRKGKLETVMELVSLER